MKRFWPRLILAILLIIVVAVPYAMLHVVLGNFRLDLPGLLYYTLKVCLIVASCMAAGLIIAALEMEVK